MLRQEISADVTTDLIRDRTPSIQNHLKREDFGTLRCGHEL